MNCLQCYDLIRVFELRLRGYVKARAASTKDLQGVQLTHEEREKQRGRRTVQPDSP